MSKLTDLLGKSLRELENTGAAVRIARDLKWAEGPAFISDMGLWIFSDIPNDRILAYAPSENTWLFRQPSNFANGQCPLRNGGFLTCEHLTRSVTFTDTDGKVTVLCDRYKGQRLNSPNDVVQAPDGAVWFSDPTYGIVSDIEGRRAQPEQNECRVYRLDLSTLELSAEVSGLTMPNGLCFSPSGSLLYVADSGADMGPNIPFDPQGPRDVFTFPIDASGRVAGLGSHFCRITSGVPDGLRCDEYGNLWIATAEGIECYDPGGRKIGLIRCHEVASNLAFGGVDDREVCITTATEAWLVRF